MNLPQQRALRIVILFGIVSLLADVTYESARGIIGPYLGLLGASAAVVGLITGAGELLGYGVRILAGALADRSRRHWLLVWIGYSINVLAVPLLALVGRWELAAALVLVERLGKALRTPARDALLSRVTDVLGHGRGFGIHEALDQIGAVVGPLLVGLSLAMGLGYRTTYGLLLLPALAALGVLLVVWRGGSIPGGVLHHHSTGSPTAYPLPSRYWVVVTAAGLAGAGFTDFPLLAFHLHKSSVTADPAVPLLYAGAMAIDGGAALLLGRLFDRYGVTVLAGATTLSALATPLVVVGSLWAAVLGVVAWGIGMGVHESVLRASVARMVHAEKRGTAFGVWSGWYGMAWFVGSSLQGLLYGISPMAMASFSALMQLSAALVWWRLHQQAKSRYSL